LATPGHVEVANPTAVAFLDLVLDSIKRLLLALSPGTGIGLFEDLQLKLNKQ
jgi:hypothetical protein